jgi:hypothetical protein
MKNGTKLLLGILCAVILALTLHYCVRSSEQVRLVPLDDDVEIHSATAPLSHARARAADPLAAMACAFKTPIVLHGRVEDQNGGFSEMNCGESTHIQSDHENADPVSTRDSWHPRCIM